MRQAAASGADLATKAARNDEVGVSRLALLAVLGLGCGFLIFNFQHILAISHIHISLAHSHRTTAFCAFAGCKLGQEEGHISRHTGAELAGSAEAVADQWVDPPASNETIQALSARVCGSPAVDGYAHVDSKCLESSPTSKWWVHYYIRGGRQSDLIAHIEKSADYDGLAVAWGIGHKMATAEDCAMACMMHMPGSIKGPFEKLPCNAFTWCAEEVCFEPDAHTHTKGDCWLKFTEGPLNPEINFRGVLPSEYRQRHKTAPEAVQWWSGVLLPPGVQPTNGTYGPRWKW